MLDDLGAESVARSSVYGVCGRDKSFWRRGGKEGRDSTIISAHSYGEAGARSSLTLAILRILPCPDLDLTTLDLPLALHAGFLTHKRSLSCSSGQGSATRLTSEPIDDLDLVKGMNRRRKTCVEIRASAA